MYPIVGATLFVLACAIFIAYAMHRKEKGCPLFEDSDEVGMNYIGVFFGFFISACFWPFAVPASIVGYTVFSVTKAFLKKSETKTETTK